MNILSTKARSRLNRCLKAQIFKHPVDKCHWCLRPLEWCEAILDHVKELAAGGTDDESNLVIACGACNSTRSGHLSRKQTKKEANLSRATVNFMMALATGQDIPRPPH